MANSVGAAIARVWTTTKPADNPLVTPPTGSRSTPRSRVAGQVSQSQILMQLGVSNPNSQAFKNQINGNGRLQQFYNTKAGLKGLPAPFDPSLAQALIQDILPLAAIASTPAAIAAAGGTAADAAAGAGAAAKKLPGGLKGAALYGGVAAAITSPLDFLKFIAWIFHPRNVLRAVEFLVGIALIAFGFNAAKQARGEGIEGFTSSEGVISRSGLGRVATELGRAARGSGGGSSGRRPQRPRSAPHRTRQRALTQRYQREEDLQRRRAKAPRPKKSP